MAANKISVFCLVWMAGSVPSLVAADPYAKARAAQIRSEIEEKRAKLAAKTPSSRNNSASKSTPKGLNPIDPVETEDRLKRDHEALKQKVKKYRAEQKAATEKRKASQLDFHFEPGQVFGYRYEILLPSGSRYLGYPVYRVVDITPRQESYVMGIARLRLQAKNSAGEFVNQPGEDIWLDSFLLYDKPMHRFEVTKERSGLNYESLPGQAHLVMRPSSLLFPALPGHSDDHVSRDVSATYGSFFAKDGRKGRLISETLGRPINDIECDVLQTHVFRTTDDLPKLEFKFDGQSRFNNKLGRVVEAKGEYQRQNDTQKLPIRFVVKSLEGDELNEAIKRSKVDLAAMPEKLLPREAMRKRVDRPAPVPDTPTFLKTGADALPGAPLLFFTRRHWYEVRVVEKIDQFHFKVQFVGSDELEDANISCLLPGTESTR